MDNGQAQVVNKNQQDLALALQPKYVHMVTINPEDLAPTQLLSFMQYMHEYSQVPKTYLLAFWKNIGSPFALLALVLIACSFIFGPLRQQSMGFRLVIALFVGWASITYKTSWAMRVWSMHHRQLGLYFCQLY